MAIKNEVHENSPKQATLSKQNRKRTSENMTEAPSVVKKKKSTDKVSAYRKSLTTEAKDVIKQKNKRQQALKRGSLTSITKKTINQRRRAQYALKKNLLSVEEKDKVKQKSTQQKHLTRMKSRQLNAEKGIIVFRQDFDENGIEPYSVGSMTYICSACHALMFQKELHRGSVFSLCCGYGKIKVPDIKPPPPMLQTLLTANSASAKDFRTHIRCYNSALALSSIGVELGETFKFDTKGPWTYKISGQVYHSLGTIFPKINSSPVFSQLYVYDREHELSNREKGNPDNMDKKTLKQLRDMMHEHNPYVKEYIKAADMIQENTSQDIRLVLKASGTPDPRRFNLPTGNDIAIVIPQINTDKPTYRDVVLIWGITMAISFPVGRLNLLGSGVPDAFSTKRIS